MKLRPLYIFIFSIFALLAHCVRAVAGQVDKTDPAFLALRDSMTHAFNAGDSARFFVALGNLEDFLLERGDLHGYYTQRCNEIVFLMNRQNIFEAYKLSMKLSKELRERKLHSELYMAINMMGHIYNYCGNEKMARQCFKEAIERMEAQGYVESMPPIYMNMVQVIIDKDPEEAMRLLDKAGQIARNTNRMVDIDAYRTIHAFKSGNMPAFQQGYKRYKEAVAGGQSSVHANTLEVFHLLGQGDVEGAIAKTMENESDRYSLQTYVYEWAGRWKEAYRALKREMEANDSINSIILSNNMQGIQNELELYEAERDAAQQRIIALTAVAACMLIIIVALFVYNYQKRRYIQELRLARDHALESDRMKTAFISNISHEIRTPLNIISGFTQVMNDADSQLSAEEQKDITKMMMHNTNLITQLVDELIDLSIIDSTSVPELKDAVRCNELCSELIALSREQHPDGVPLLLKSEVDGQYELLTNRGMLRKVLSALIDNAMKYTAEGQVTVIVRQQPSAVAFIVEDTGCGIPPADAERIFERFEKLDHFKTGLGLGLSLARKLTQLLGGTLCLDTSYTAGARFVATIPHL